METSWAALAPDSAMTDMIFVTRHGTLATSPFATFLWAHKPLALSATSEATLAIVSLAVFSFSRIASLVCEAVDEAVARAVFQAVFCASEDTCFEARILRKRATISSSVLDERIAAAAASDCWAGGVSLTTLAFFA